MEQNIDDNVIKYYVDAQKKKEEDIIYYLKNYKIPLYYKDENFIEDIYSEYDFIHTEGRGDAEPYYSYITNKFKIFEENEDPYTIKYDKDNILMVNERKKLYNIIVLVNASYLRYKEQYNNPNGFRINSVESELLDNINMYNLCDEDLKKYITIVLKDNKYISQSVVVSNEDLSFTIVNNVFTFELCKENVYLPNGKKEPYNLPITLLHSRLLQFGMTKDQQRSKVVLRFKPSFRSSILGFKSGICVSTGAPTESMAKLLVQYFIRLLRNFCNFKDIDIGNIKCQNKVAAARIRFGVCLHLLASKHNFIQYDTEKFAGAIIEPPERKDKVTILAFDTQKIICVGAKNIEGIKNAYNYVYPLLQLCIKTPKNIEYEEAIISNIEKSKLSEYNNINSYELNNNINGNITIHSIQKGKRGRGRGRGRGIGFREPKKILVTPNTNIRGRGRGRPRKHFK